MSEQPRPREDRWSTWLTTERFAGQDSATRHSGATLLASIRDQVLATARLRPGARVVDLGAGTGLLTTRAAALVAPAGMITALDLSHAALQAWDTAGELAGVHRVVADATNLPLTASVADAVVARSVLIYLPDLAQTFREIARVLRPGGHLSVFEPINGRRSHDARLDGLTDDELAAVDRLRSEQTTASQTMLAFDEGKAVALAEATGLTVHTVHVDTVTEQLSDSAAVEAHLQRRPHPGASPMLERIRTALGEDTAQRYRRAWLHAVRTQGTITYTTPVMFLGAEKRSA